MKLPNALGKPWGKSQSGAPFWTHSRRALASEAGGTMLEFAVVAVLLMTAIFGIMDCCRAVYFDHYVRYSAEEAARFAMVRGSTWKNAPCALPSSENCTATSSDITGLVRSITTMGNDSNLAVVTTWTGKTPTGAACSSSGVVNSPGCVVQVKVSYSFNFVLPFLPRNTLVLTSTSAMAISQ